MNKDPSSRFVFFGTPAVARDTLRALIENGFTPSLIVTAPDMPRGRGLIVTPSEVKVLAQKHNIPVFTPAALDIAAIDHIRKAESIYALVVAYGKILPEALINIFPKGVLNVHYSLLPKYRGASPLEAALLAGEHETGVTIQKMAKELDAGDIIAQEAIAIASDETARELRPQLITLGTALLIRTLPNYLAGTITLQKQDASQATFTHKFKKEDGRLDLASLAEENWKKYRAYNDTIGTYFFTADGTRAKITSAHFSNKQFVIDRIVPEGKREMSYVDFVKATGRSVPSA